MHLIIRTKETDKVEIINLYGVVQVVIDKPKWITHKIKKDKRGRIFIDLS